ncbi:ornithinee aminotransferase [Rothia sp. (in: high G+C Gram-positive bacteria)]|uniref:ornithinee aminotransferase n=1 Tax=Rothia sp. (in: high G+C Gram-positive bacteria) TaxID=1885016 RepID=UPI0025F94266|nr:ornithinee aminotransferase [Rothia sp. (in: high G+C Gram-positive bacteria)]
MSFFGIGKKKLDEQSREEQSAETAKAQKEQASEDAPKSARLSEKIMEQQQWEDSLRRFVKSESARQQNNDEEQNEEHRAVEDLKRALLNGDEKVEESSAADELTEEQVEEQERRSLLAALGAFPQGSEEPVEVEQVAEGQDIEEDAAPVAEAPKPATPAFLRDDEETEAEDASVEAQEAPADVEEPKDAAEDARSHFEQHLRALRAQNTEDTAAEAAEETADEAEGGEEHEAVDAVVEATENNSENAHSVSEAESADAEDSLTVEDMKAAGTGAAVTEAQNAGLDDLAAAYAARLGITLDSEEETFGEIASDEVIAEEATADEVAAEVADSAEATEDAEATEPTEVSDTEAPEIFEAAEAEETVDLTAVVAEAAEPAAAVEEEPIEAVVEAPELLASELTEEESAVSDETELLSAVSVEEKREVSVSESLEAEDFDAEEENTAELIFDASAAEEPATEENAVEESAEVEAEEETPAPVATATEVEDSEVENLVAEGTASEEDEPAKSASVAPALAAVAAPVAAAAAVASAAKAEKAEEKTEKGTSQGIALTAEGIDKKEAEKHESAACEESAEAPVAELKETEQKLSEDEAELVAESIILSEPVEGAATLPVLPEERALYSLAELMRTRGSGTMSLELRQVDEDMHYRLLHRGREVETGIVVPGVDWFAPVAALYTEAQQAGATWNRAAVSLKPRLGDGLEVHASYLGAVDGQTTGESFLLGGSTVEAKPVATAEAAEATLQDEPQEAAVQSVDSVEAEREAIEHELEAELAEKQAANEAAATAEAAEEPVVESAEEGTSSGLLAATGLAAAGTAVAGSAAAAQEKEDVEEAVEASDEPAQNEFAPVEAEFEHDYENDPVFGVATVEPETEQAEELTAEASEASETPAQASDESGEDMEAALAAIVANAQKKLDAEEAPAEDVLAVEEQKATAPVVAESFTLDRTQPVEEAAEEPAAEQTEEPALPAFLDDAELLPEHEASAASTEAHAEEPALEDAEPAAESASVAPGLAGALAAAAAVGTAGAAAKATEAKVSEAKVVGAQEEPAEKAAELKTVEVTSAAKIAEAPAVEAAPATLPETAPAGLSSSISASALSELNQLPTIVAEPDTPSAAVQSPLVPSETQLASGNLVLTEAQVAQRLAPVVEHLFGENGTAKDATTVLIRVRALGSYYDALTHVRRNGFWEQVRTFELIPETLLDIPALKTDSYSEGEGSPLAMSLTFTPGVPVQAAFDYANEQAFVTYPRPLDAERYVEELRMFPRLGSKIPAHMTSALSHWNL